MQRMKPIKGEVSVCSAREGEGEEMIRLGFPVQEHAQPPLEAHYYLSISDAKDLAVRIQDMLDIVDRMNQRGR